MLIITDALSMSRALITTLNPWLRQMLALRCDQFRDAGITIGELGHIIIVEAGDALGSIEQAAGLPIATNLVDGARWPDPDFVPSWEYIQSDHSWHEIVFITCDDGAGVVLLVPDREGIDPTLRAIIHTFAAGDDDAP